MRVLVGGDIVFSERDAFCKYSDLSCLDSSLVFEWLNSDCMVINLEAPICRRGLRGIEKSGPNLRMDKKKVQVVKMLRPDIICLANNHILDYGNIGAKDTIDCLNKECLRFIGVGRKEDANLAVFKKNGISIGVYNVCDTEFNVLKNSNYSANGFEGARSFSRFSSGLAENYLAQMHHETFCDKIKRKLFGTQPKEKYTKQEMLNIQNILQCSAHREVVIDAIKNIGDNNESF